MRVCVIGTRGFPFVEGGVEKHCEMLYPLIGKQEDTEIIVFRRRSYIKDNRTKYEGIRFVDLPSTQIKGFEAVLHSLLATLRAIVLRADVVHYHNIGPALFAPLLRLFSIPVVLTYHSANYEHKKWGFFARNLLRFCEWIALRCSEKIIFVNSFQMKKYPQYVQKKSCYIPNGIAKPIMPDSCSYLKSIGVEPGKYILSVGRITQEKGFDTLIRAYKSAHLHECKLVIAGGVEFESGYMQQLKTLSQNAQVVFTGYVYGEDLAQLYANASLFVLASNNEGFPLVMLEAMSYERDVLLSDIPATRLAALEEEAYFPRGNSDCLSEKITQKMQKPRRRSYDLTPYDWNQVARQTLDIFRYTGRKHKAKVKL